MTMIRQQQFLVKYSINYPSGKKWVTEKKTMGITKLGAIDRIKWIHSNNDVTIISVEPTGVYGRLSDFGNHTIGER
jgi:hypothetical protein